MSLILLGLNHQTAPLSVREQVVFSRDEAQATLRLLREEHNVTQALLVSTCNRTELYALVPDLEATEEYLRQNLFIERIAEQNGDRSRYLYRREGDEAVQHLFRVACGLDSLVLGEQEILGQVKTAYEISRSVDAAGSLFHRLATRAFHVGKRARTDTQIGLGAVSVAFAAVDLAEKVFQSLEGRGALLVGAGENGALCAQHLLSRKVKPLLIANRTLAKAENLAQQLEGETASFERLSEAMSRVDIVVCTTGSPDPVIDRDMVKTAMKARDNRALVLIDIAVPRDVDPKVDDVQSVFRFDMDALSDIVDQNMERRRKEVPVVEGLIQNEVENFMRWWRSLAAGPVIRDLNRAFEEVRDLEVGKNAKRFAQEDREQLEIFSRNLVRKLLMGVTTEIKQYRAENPREMERLGALRKVFRLDEEGEERKGTDREE